MLTSTPYFSAPQNLDALNGVPSVKLILELLGTGDATTVDDDRTTIAPDGLGGVSVTAIMRNNPAWIIMDLSRSPDGEVKAWGWAWNTILWLDTWGKTLEMFKPTGLDVIGDCLTALDISDADWLNEMRVQTKHQRSHGVKVPKKVSPRFLRRTIKQAVKAALATA